MRCPCGTMRTAGARAARKSRLASLTARPRRWPRCSGCTTVIICHAWAGVSSAKSSSVMATSRPDGDVLGDGGQLVAPTLRDELVVLAEALRVPDLLLSLSVAGGLVGRHDAQQLALVLEVLVGPGRLERQGAVVVGVGRPATTARSSSRRACVHRDGELAQVAGQRRLEPTLGAKGRDGWSVGRRQRDVDDGVQRAPPVGHGAARPSSRRSPSRLPGGGGPGGRPP